MIIVFMEKAVAHDVSRNITKFSVSISTLFFYFENDCTSDLFFYRIYRAHNQAIMRFNSLIVNDKKSSQARSSRLLFSHDVTHDPDCYLIMEQIRVLFL